VLACHWHFLSWSVLPSGGGGGGGNPQSPYAKIPCKKRLAAENAVSEALM
jgi:hypothetical protein